MPAPPDAERWKRHNEAARRADVAADRAKTMEERLAEAASLSTIATQLRENLETQPAPRVRPD